MPRVHDVTGRACQQDADCGAGFVCFKAACAQAGTVASVSVTPAGLAAGTDQGGTALSALGVHRTPTAIGIAGWVADAGTPLPTAVFEHASVAFAGHLYTLGGWPGSEPPVDAVWAAPLADDGTVGAGVPQPGLPSARRGAGAVAFNGHLYVVGGQGVGGVPLDTVVQAPLAADGSLGPWQAVSTLPSGRSGLQVVESEGFLLAVGGTGGTGVLSDVLAAPVHGDGSLGAWSLAGRLPPPGRAGLGALAYQGWLYVVGGACGAECGALGSRVLTDGTLGPWRTLTAPALARAKLGLVGWAGALYAVGGQRSDGTAVSEVDAALLNADGTLGPWTVMPPLQPAVFSAGVSAWNGQVVVTGGSDGLRALASVQRAAVLASNTTGPFTSSPDAPGVRAGPAGAFYNGALYVAGGSVGGVTVAAELTSVARGLIDADGGIAGWTDAGTLLMPTAYASGAVYDHRFYVLGGCTGGNYCGTGLTNVEMATFQLDGTLGAFSQTTPLPGGQELQSLGSAAYDGVLYAIGGYTHYRSVNTVSTAALDPITGAVGAWQPGPALPADGGIESPGVAAYNRVLYVVGGHGDDYWASVWMGRLNPDGSIQGWTPTTPLPRGRSGAAVVGSDDNLYVIGGCNNDNGQSYCGNRLDEVWVARIQSDGTVGRWSLAAPLVTARSEVAVALMGSWLVASHGHNRSGPDNVVESAPVVGAGTLSPWSAGPSLPAPRELHAATAVADRVFVAGGAGAAEVWWAEVDGGNLSTWNPGPSLPAARAELALVNVSGTLVALGGSNSGGTPAAEVWGWPKGAAGWAPLPSLPQPVRGPAGAAFGGHLYALGGVDSAKVFLADAADGGVGAWRETQSLPLARWGHGAVAYDGFVYVLGGQTPGGGASDILFARMGADGSLGNWVKTAGLPGRRDHLAVAAQSGYLYVLGGHRADLDAGVGSAAMLTEVEGAPIHQDGTLGEFTAMGGLPAPLENAAAAIAGGQLFLIGGRGDAPVATVSRATLRTPAAVGRYSLQVDLGSTLTSLDSLQLSGSSTNLGPYRIGSRTAGKDGVYGPWGVGVSASPAVDVPLKVPGVRYLSLDLWLDDLQTGARDPGAPPRDLTGATLSTHP